MIAVTIRNTDDHVEDRKGTVAVFNVPEPPVLLPETEVTETEAVAAFICAALADGVLAREIGVFVRDTDRLARARAAAVAAGRGVVELSDRDEAPGERVSIGTMHLAKGLEFKAVAVMACGEDALPQRRGWKPSRTKQNWRTSTIRSGNCCVSPRPGPAIG